MCRITVKVLLLVNYILMFTTIVRLTNGSSLYVTKQKNNTTLKEMNRQNQLSIQTSNDVSIINKRRQFNRYLINKENRSFNTTFIDISKKAENQTILKNTDISQQNANETVVNYKEKDYGTILWIG
jgi:hypothetical protein